MCTCRILCVTSRRLAEGELEDRLQRIEAAGAEGIILREKDMEAEAYRELAERLGKVCPGLILHTHTETARELGIRRIHLTWEGLCRLEPGDRRWFERIGVSVHAAKEAAAARELGASYVTAGHIFPTACKQDAPPRGTGFLKEVCEAAGAGFPVYAIGGIGPDNVRSCLEAGAAGVCLMSSLMQAEDPGQYIRRLQQAAGA